MEPTFADKVRVLTTAATEAAGYAGWEGYVYGVTTPSVTGVEVIGLPLDDSAVNVHFEEHDRGVWFAPSLIEVIDHAPGTEIRLEGVDKRWIRQADGGWREESVAEEKKPWWRFW